MIAVIIDTTGLDCQRVNFNIGASTTTSRSWDIYVTQYTIHLWSRRCSWATRMLTILHRNNWTCQKVRLTIKKLRSGLILFSLSAMVTQQVTLHQLVEQMLVPLICRIKTTWCVSDVKKTIVTFVGLHGIPSLLMPVLD